MDTFSRWWFQFFFIFTPIWGRFPFWLICFKWVVQPPTSFVLVGCGSVFFNRAGRWPLPCKTNWVQEVGRSFARFFREQKGWLQLAFQTLNRQGFQNRFSPPKSNSSPLKDDGWKIIFFLKWSIFTGYVALWGEYSLNTLYGKEWEPLI